jgi:hypothetical protein
VSSRDLGDAVEIHVRDNGVGIPLEIKDKLFQPFFTTKPTGEGTGLGLSISYDIVPMSMVARSVSTARSASSPNHRSTAAHLRRDNRGGGIMSVSIPVVDDSSMSPTCFGSGSAVRQQTRRSIDRLLTRLPDRSSKVAFWGEPV